MYITEKIAVKIGNNARTLLNADENKEQIIVYGAINLFQSIFAILWVTIAGLLFGVFYEAMIFSITVSILRKYSGGAHASSPSRCNIIGTTLSVGAGLLVDKILYKINIWIVIPICIVFIVFAFIVIVKNAPVDSINKPITDVDIRREFKKKSEWVIFIFSIIIIILCILSKKYSELYYIKFIESISIGVLWQTITLTKNGISFLNKINFILKYIIEGGEKV